MLNLSFNQKVGLGFAIILFLLAISGGNSLWNLNDISSSNNRVHETAVPVVRVANQVQIQLLKLANVSALAYNALTEEEIKPYRDDFDKGAAEFGSIYTKLEGLAKDDEDMRPLVTEIKKNYDEYKVAVNAMFDAKLAQLVAKKKTDTSAEEMIQMADEVGNSYMDIVYFEAPEKHKKDMELAAGNANQADSALATLSKTVQELQRTNDLARLDTAMEDMGYVLSETRRWFDMVVQYMQPFDEQGLTKNTLELLTTLEEKIAKTPGLVDHKRDQLMQVETAKQKLTEAKISVDKSVKGLDDLLASADTTFTRLQKELSDSLSFGFKSTIVIMIVLFILATQNFNSMRLAIRKKMIDLAKLNRIGGTLAAARDQSSALDEVLHAMSDKIGIEQGSVYLFNKNHELEAKAFLPPMQVEGEHKAITFTMGQGIIGRAAESKKAIFVPDTSKDKHYVSGENDKPRALLCVPLVDKDILIGVMNFSGDTKNVAFADSDYEFVSSVAVSLVTTIKNIRMVEVIEEHNRNLEKKVEERTAALKQKNEDIANMLSNMHQGLFTIVEGGLIHPEYAAYLETIFQTPNIANRNFIDLLFKNCNLSIDAIDAATTSVASIVGEDAMMYEFNSHLLAKELTLKFDGKPDKLLELDWDPITDENDVVTKLMVTVRDVTELKALQAEAEGQKQELMMIGEILAVDGEKFNEFLSGSYHFVEKCRNIIQETDEKDKEKIAELFRNIHTVKGNARTYGLKHITETVHKIENTYDQLRKNEELEWQREQLLAELDTGEQVINRYNSIFKEKLGRGGSSTGSSIKVDKQHASALLQKITELSGEKLPTNVASVVRETYNMLASVEAKTIGEVISDVIKSTTSLAKELGRAEPNIVVHHGGVFIRAEAHGILNNIFMHLLRNAIDHGIEGGAERVAKGKPEQGTVWINTAAKNGKATIAVIDNGRGLAISKIYQKALERGLCTADGPRPTVETIANYIFASGFSTADQVSEVSGRGVGMDAVKQFLFSVGGGIELVLDQGAETDDFRGFIILITLPEQYYILPPVFAKAS